MRDRSYISRQARSKKEERAVKTRIQESGEEVVLATFPKKPGVPRKYGIKKTNEPESEPS